MLVEILPTQQLQVLLVPEVEAEVQMLQQQAQEELEVTVETLEVEEVEEVPEELLEAPVVQVDAPKSE